MGIGVFELFGASFIIVTTIMVVFWLIGAFKNNAGIVDFGWAVSFIALSITYFILGNGDFFKRLVLDLMVLLWSLRLAWHFWKRFDFSFEDPRYSALKNRLGKELIRFKILLLFLFQAYLIIILSLPFVIVSGYGEASWHIVEGVGVLFWIIGLIGEAFSDRQLEEFKKVPGNKEEVCHSGFWKFSRHPNYFFEWLIWIGYFLFALPSPGGWVSIISPLLMLLFLTKISGIPPAEEQALKSKGAAYEEYQKKTSAFMPLPPKN